MSKKGWKALANGRDFITGIAVGVGGTMASRHVLPVLAPIMAPLAKQGLKAAILGYERGRELLAEFSENVSDVMAEVQSELREERMAIDVETNGAGTAD